MRPSWIGSKAGWKFVSEVGDSSLFFRHPDDVSELKIETAIGWAVPPIR
jgi:hypothetical protein